MYTAVVGPAVVLGAAHGTQSTFQYRLGRICMDDAGNAAHGLFPAPQSCKATHIRNRAGVFGVISYWIVRHGSVRMSKHTIPFHDFILS